LLLLLVLLLMFLLLMLLLLLMKKMNRKLSTVRYFVSLIKTPSKCHREKNVF
jgi:hypothetical protein